MTPPPRQDGQELHRYTFLVEQINCRHLARSGRRTPAGPRGRRPECEPSWNPPFNQWSCAPSVRRGPR